MDLTEKLIKAFHVNNLPNDNHLPFFLLVSERAAADEAVNRRFALFVQKLAAAVAKEDEAMHQLQASPLTPEITELDNRRDQTYLAIERVVDGYLRFPQPQTQADARKIETYMKSNKVNIAAQYDREYGQIMNLIQDIEAHCQAEVERLNLTVMFASLKHDNEEIFRLLDERDLLNSTRVKKLVRDSRQRTDFYYHAFVEVINAYIKIDDGDDLVPFTQGVNETIDRLNLQVFKIKTSGSSTGSQLPDAGTEGGDDNTDTEGDNNENGGNENDNNTGNENPGGSIPTNPQPGTDDDPDL